MARHAIPHDHACDSKLKDMTLGTVQKYMTMHNHRSISNQILSIDIGYRVVLHALVT